MKLHILSDIHLEFAPFDVPETGADAVILAGDIGVGTKGLEWALRTFAGKPVIYVAGNHEYYHQHREDTDQALRAMASAAGAYFLQDDEVVLGGVRFLGSTLWTDFAANGEETVAQAQAQNGLMMNDYSVISTGDERRKFSPADALQLHQASRKFLEERLAVVHAGPTVVVTHHAPTPSSLPIWVQDGGLKAACFSRLEGMMDAKRVRLWVFGHTHWWVDEQIRGTRVVSNQRGYPRQRVPAFDPGFLVEV